MENNINVQGEKTFDVVEFVISYECGELDNDQAIEGFQHLINTGLAWKLQGLYGRTATALIEAGYCFKN